jgi:hypothetical protein
MDRGLPAIVAVAIRESALDPWIRVAALVGSLSSTTYGLYPRKDGSL